MVTLITRPVQKSTNARVTFSRIVRNNPGVVRAESLNDAKMYQEFFDKLSQSIFLTANQI
jgi:hypothetical protein